MQISAIQGKANPDIIGIFGIFRLEFIDKGIGDRVVIACKKEGMEVVNTMEQEIILSADPNIPLNLIMCAKDQRDKYASLYYQIIIKEGIDREYHERYTRILNERIEEREQAIARLKQEKEIALAQAEEWAQRFARIKLEEVSALYKEAWQHFRNGDIEKAIKTLDESRIDQALARMCGEGDNYRSEPEIYS